MAEIFDLGAELEKITKPQTESPKKPEPRKALSFPYQAITGAAGYFADVFSNYLEAPPQFLFMGYLTALGAVVSRTVAINSELNTQPRLYVVLVGESASDRKSTTLNCVVKHFKSVVDNFSACWGIGSAEGLRRVVSKKKDDFCALELGDPPGTLLVFDEFKSFVNKCKIDASVLLPCVNTFFESNHYETHTKKQSVCIEDACFSMLAASTIQTYERVYTEAFIDIGFPNRIFLVTGTAARRFALPKRIPEKENEIMRRNLIEVLRHVGNGITLDLDQSAYELYERWYLNIEQSVHAKRMDTYSLRLMQLLAINEKKSVIDVETVENAIALCDWQIEVRSVHDPIDADSKIAEMEIKMRRVLGRGPKKDRELKQQTNATRSGLWFYNSALKNLRAAGEIAWNKKDKAWFLTKQ